MNNARSIRIGPISIFAFVVVLCIAVLSVLSFATSQAHIAITEKQAAIVASTYANDSAAQRLLFKVNEAVADARSHDNDIKQAVEDVLNASTNKALSPLAASEFDENALRASFMQSDGRTLDILLVKEDDGSLTAKEWKSTTQHSESHNTDKLWSGGSK